jgi:Nitrile hydratase, alpha chain
MEAGGGFNAVFSKVVAQAWSDPDYKSRLMSDPKAVLAEAGVTLDEDADIEVIEDTAAVRHIVIPAPPAEGELSEDALEQVAGGTTKVTWKT